MKKTNNITVFYSRQYGKVRLVTKSIGSYPTYYRGQLVGRWNPWAEGRRIYFVPGQLVWLHKDFFTPLKLLSMNKAQLILEARRACEALAAANSFIHETLDELSVDQVVPAMSWYQLGANVNVIFECGRDLMEKIDQISKL